MENMENRYLDRLSDLYPTIAAASEEWVWCREKQD